MSRQYGPAGQCRHGLHNGCSECHATPPQRDVEQEVREAREDFNSKHSDCCVVRINAVSGDVPPCWRLSDALARFESAVRAAAVREAHVMACLCHVQPKIPGGRTICLDGPIHPHPYTDPRCARTREGK